MYDLWTAIAVMTMISVGVGIVTAILAPKKRQPQMLWIALATFGMFAFLLYAAGRLYWARWIPNSAVIVWSNWTPLLAAVAAGVCWQLEETPRWRRLGMTLALSAIALAAVGWPFLNIAIRPQPDGGDVFNGPVAMQTSWATCSPAAAATFLNAGGVAISEADMIPRCLSDASGTPTLGLYRGVKLVARENSRDVAVTSFTLSQLMRSNDNWPVLLMVKLPISGVDDPRYAGQWGWIPGMGHSVVALGKSPDGRILIADPSKGMEAWSEKDLQVLWHGDGISFVNE
jgi:hypothetical protein